MSPLSTSLDILDKPTLEIVLKVPWTPYQDCPLPITLSVPFPHIQLLTPFGSFWVNDHISDQGLLI